MGAGRRSGAVAATLPIVHSLERWKDGLHLTMRRRAVLEKPGPSRSDLARRVVALLFAVAQGSIVLRIVFLLLQANQKNVLVSSVLNVSQYFVAPFEGILHTNALDAGGSILDLAAVLALVGWSILEPIVMAAVTIFAREPG